MEQHDGASGATKSSAARTILPGEPFDLPSNSQVPGPREAAEQAPLEGEPAYASPVFAAPQAAADPYDVPVYEVSAAPAGQVVTGSEFEALQDYASLPPAGGAFAAATFDSPVAPPPAGMPLVPPPAPSAAVPPVPPPPVAPGFGPAVPASPVAPAGVVPPAQPMDSYPAPYAPVPPTAAAAAPVALAAAAAPHIPAPFSPPAWDFPALPAEPQAAVDPGFDHAPPASDEDALPVEGKKRRERKGIDKRLLVGGLVVVVAAGGYFGYTQLSKKSGSSAATPPPVVAPVRPAVVHYNFPSNVSGLPLQTGATAATQARQLRAFAIRAYPTFGRTVTVASYSAGSPAIVSMAFHPGVSKLDSTFATVLANVRKPAAGNVVTTFSAVAPGAAGGRMTCGGQRGASPISYCVWEGKSTVGMTYITGGANPSMNEILTRELRAYAEH